jgi:hypothetical protein
MKILAIDLGKVKSVDPGRGRIPGGGARSATAEKARAAMMIWRNLNVPIP